MATKEKELVDQLIDKTRKRKIQWEPTARDDEFVTTFGGQYSFTVGSYRTDYEYETRVVMRDYADRTMMTIRPSSDVEAEELRQLHEEARKIALKVDESIDQVLDTLKGIGE